MTNYLINCSIIWAIAYIFYVAFLQKETFYACNRFYLLGNLFLGLVLPLFKININSKITSAKAPNIIEQAVQQKENALAKLPNNIGDTDNTHNLLFFIYSVGATVMLVLLTIEIYKLYKLKKQSISSIWDGWQLIETNKIHSPFSVRNNLFISSRKNYSEQELQIISAHEKSHTNKLHFLDLVFLNIIKIIFWFHPLVYMYWQKILLIHEFEADDNIPAETNIYANFLIAQAIQGYSPKIAHSFSSSPLKQRIIMLTQNKSTTLKAIKYIAIVPILLIAFMCVSFAQQKLPIAKEIGKNKIEFNGNILEMSGEGEPENITVITKDENGKNKESIFITRTISTPIKINGETIYHNEELTDGAPKDALKSDVPSKLPQNIKSIDAYLYKKFENEFKMLPNDVYKIYNRSPFLIDKNGKMAFTASIWISGNKAPRNPTIDKSYKAIQDMLNELSTKMENEIFFNLKFIPGQVTNNNVATFYKEWNFSNAIEVTNGQIKETQLVAEPFDK